MPGRPGQAKAERHQGQQPRRCSGYRLLQLRYAPAGRQRLGQVHRGIDGHLVSAILQHGLQRISHRERALRGEQAGRPQLRLDDAQVEPAKRVTRAGPDRPPERLRRSAVLVFTGQLDAQVVCRREGTRIAVQGLAVVPRRLHDPAGPVSDEPGGHEEDRILRVRGQRHALQCRCGARVAETEIRQRGIVVQYLGPDAASELRHPVKRVGIVLHRGVQVARFALVVRGLFAGVVGDRRELGRRIEGRRILLVVALRCQQIERAERLDRLGRAAGGEQRRARSSSAWSTARLSLELARRGRRAARPNSAAASLYRCIRKSISPRRSTGSASLSPQADCHCPAYFFAAGSLPAQRSRFCPASATPSAVMRF